MMNRITISPEKIQHELQELVQVSLHEALRRVFGRVEKQLFEKTETVSDKSVRKALFSAIAHGRTAQKTFYQSVFEQLLDAEQPQSPPEQWHTLTGDRGTAVELEDSLEAARKSTSGEHAQFLARMQHLHELEPTIPARFYSLESITRAVIEQSKQLPPLMHKTFIHTFVNQGIGQISPIYSILNDYLIQIGLLPTIRRMSSKEQAQAMDSQADGGFTSANAFMQAMIDRVSELLEEQIDGEPTATFEFDQNSDWTVSDFSNFIKTQIAPDLPDAHWPAKPADIIHVVGVTLADILNDALIDAQFRAQIGRLQMAVLLTASQNRHFLADPEHPLRRILNCLAELGATLGQDETLTPVQALVDDTLKATLHEPEQLETLAASIESLARDIEQQPVKERSEERLAPVVARCRERVHLILKGQTAHTPLNPVTKAFVWSALAPFMVRTMINQGRNNRFWSQIIQVLKEALALQMDMPVSKAKAERFADRIYPLLQADDDHLRATEEETLLVKRFIEALSSRPQSKKSRKPKPQQRPAEQKTNETTPATAATEQTEAQAPAAAQKPAEDSQEPASEPEIPATQDSATAKTSTDSTTADQSSASKPPEPHSTTDESPRLSWLGEPRILEIFQQMIRSGEWFEVYTGPGRAVRRLKMRRVDPEKQLIHFANRTGHIILSLPTAQVVDDLVSQRTRLVFDGPVFSRLIEELAQFQRKLNQEGV